MPKLTFRGGVHPLHSAHEGKLPTRNKPVRDFAPEQVSILMGMHLGAPSKPCVQKGDHVKMGQLIGEPVGGLGVAVIRAFGNYPEGVTYGILVMNVATPLIDKFIKNRVYGHRKEERANA